MLIGVRKEQELADHLSQQQAPPQSYWSIVRQQFRKNRMAVWSLRVLYVLGFIALFADFIANEKPIYAKLDGESHFPVLRSYAVGLGLDSWEARFFQNSWHEHDYDYVIWAPIPYSAQTMDRKNRNYVAPGDEQDVPSTRFRHRPTGQRCGCRDDCRHPHGHAGRYCSNEYCRADRHLPGRTGWLLWR